METITRQEAEDEFVSSRNDDADFRALYDTDDFFNWLKDNNLTLID